MLLKHAISIWFFIGSLLTVYGVLILGTGVYGVFEGNLFIPQSVVGSYLSHVVVKSGGHVHATYQEGIDVVTTRALPRIVGKYPNRFIVECSQLRKEKFALPIAFG